MPFVGVETNVPEASITTELLNALSSQVADSLGKPEKYVQVSVRGGAKLTFGRSSEPAAMVTVLSVGSLSPEQNRHHSKVIFKILDDYLKISSSRAYIHYVDIPEQKLGFKGDTFDRVKASLF